MHPRHAITVHLPLFPRALPALAMLVLGACKSDVNIVTKAPVEEEEVVVP